MSRTPGPVRLVVLASGSGTTVQAVLDDPRLRPHVVAVGSDKPGCHALERARTSGVGTFTVAPAEHADRPAWNRALERAIAAHEPDLVVLAGFMRIVDPGVVARFRIVNTHPALLPAFPGGHAIRDALAAGATSTGVTVHWVDEGVDTGPVIAQVTVPVEPEDDEDSLRVRVQTAEKPLYLQTLTELVSKGSFMTQIAVRRALISVYDKTGLEDLARGLHEAGVEIVSTGSTAARIRELGVPVTAVDEVTGFPEILGGRVKTLHPNVHAGLLADQTDEAHVETIAGLGIAAFQLLVVNLYPFAQTVASGAGQPEVIEQIDIGGPAMVRASAKNHGSVAVVTDPARYADVLTAVRSGGFDLPGRQRLALDAFRHTATYDIGVASWLGSVVAPDDEIEGQSTGFPGWVGANYERAAVLRYGENPHQQAALYVIPGHGGGVAHADQLQGKEMSYNNYVDADAAWRAAYDFDDPCVAIIKHANPCGIAVGADIAEAHRKAHDCDPVSAYGGVVATNRPVTLAMAEQLADIFTEVVVAPGFDDDALERFGRKKNLRLLVAKPRPDHPTVERRPISGGLLLQTADRIDAPGDDPASWTLAAGDAVDDATLADLAFAWRAVRAAKSNAILLASDGASIGVGMGQVNRVDSCRLAVSRAGDRAAGSVAASDAFFPFADGAQILIDAGVRAIVEPGGSIRDEDVVTAAKAAGVALYLTGTRHFAH